MPRQARLNLPGLFYHVMFRGIERRVIFRTDSDRWDFLERLEEGLQESGCRCFSWALMANHVHLLILSGVRGLVSLLQPLLTGYAVTFNAKYKRVGHLFQNRYKAIICEEEAYFLELVRYISLQPVRAGMIHTPEALARYPWTSHRALMGGTSLPWLETDDVMDRFGSHIAEARHNYERFIIDGWNQGRRDDLEGGGLVRSVGGIEKVQAMARAGEEQMADVRILGEGSFVEAILRQAEALELKKRLLLPNTTPADLLRDVAQFMQVDETRVLSGERTRRISEARSVLVYVAKEWAGLRGSALEDWLGISSGSLSKAYARGRRLANAGLLAELLKRKKGSNVPCR